MPDARNTRVPNLFIIGAMKSGTTTLHNHLAAHPEIHMSSTKEPCYFMSTDQLRKYWPYMAAKPCSHDKDAYLQLFETDKKAVIFGESSATYSRLPMFSGVVDRIARHNPDSRFIYIMRDPVERTISHYWHEAKNLHEHRPMPQAITKDSQYLDVSYYAMQLRTYFDRFGADRVMTLTTEEMAADPIGTLRRIFTWLGVDADFEILEPERRLHETLVEAPLWLHQPKLHRLRRSHLWNRLRRLVPRQLRAAAREQLIVTKKSDTEAADWVVEMTKFLRPIQQEQTRELEILLGRAFPEWTTLHDGPWFPHKSSGEADQAGCTRTTAMNVLIVTREFPAVSETFVLDQITGLIDRGYNIEILAHRPRDEDVIHEDVNKYDLSTKVHYTHLSKKRKANFAILIRKMFVNFCKLDLKYFRGLCSFLSLSPYNWNLTRMAEHACFYNAIKQIGHRYDAIICNYGSTAIHFELLRRSRRFSGEIIIVFHGYDLSSYLKSAGNGVYRCLFQEGGIILSVSEFWKRRLIDLGCPQDRIIVQHMGVDCARFRPPKRSHGAGEPFVFICVGRLTEKKGHLYVLRALVQLTRSSSDHPVHFQIVGDGNLRESLAEQARALGVAEHVEFLGNLTNDQVQQRLNAADAFVLPSITASNGAMEGIPVSLMEAMACELPVISTWHSGIPELVEDGINGLLVSEQDVDALAAQMKRLATDPAFARRLGKKARGTIEKDFNISALNDRLSEIIQSTNSDTVREKSGIYPA